MANYTVPPNLLQFVSIEHEQFLVSMANNRDDFAIVSQLQGLYEAALPKTSVHENDMVLFQLLTFTHYHFLFSTSCLMRCHLSEALASARIAIDADLIAAQIIHDRASQIAYAKREKPFDKLARHYRNLVRDQKPLPHRLIPTLLDLHGKLSQVASHADIDSFLHRVRISKLPEDPHIAVEYFQFSRDPSERQIHALNLFYAFVLTLDVFSDFLVTEVKLVPESWRSQLHTLGANMERHVNALREHLKQTNSAESQ